MAESARGTSEWAGRTLRGRAELRRATHEWIVFLRG